MTVHYAAFSVAAYVPQRHKLGGTHSLGHSSGQPREGETPGTRAGAHPSDFEDPQWLQVAKALWHPHTYVSRQPTDHGNSWAGGKMAASWRTSVASWWEPFPKWGMLLLWSFGSQSSHMPCKTCAIIPPVYPALNSLVTICYCRLCQRWSLPLQRCLRTLKVEKCYTSENPFHGITITSFYSHQVVFSNISREWQLHCIGKKLSLFFLSVKKENLWEELHFSSF